MMAQSGREPQVSNKCVMNFGGTLSRSTAHLTSAPRASPLEVSYSPTSLSNTIIRSVTPAGSCPKSKCMISCSCARILPSSKIAECLYSAWLLSDGLQCGSACQHDEQVAELCVHVLVQRFTRYPNTCVCCQLCGFHHPSKLEVDH